MKIQKAVDAIATMILAIGMLIAFSSHAFHAKIGLGEEASHLKHVITGLSLIVASLAILIYNNKALNVRVKK